MFQDQTTSELETLLSNIDASITRTLNAQSYGIGSRNLTRPSLQQLMELRKHVADELAARSTIGGGNIGVASFAPRTNDGTDPKYIC